MDGKVIAFMNMKGGVSKTTLCVNIANTLATLHNEKVLVIDIDPQFNASQYILSVTNKGEFEFEGNGIYNKFKQEEKTLYYLYKEPNESDSSQPENKAGLFNRVQVNNSFLKKDYIVNIKDNLDMILGDLKLIEIQLMQKTGVELLLKRYIDENRLREKYRYILIDSPPTYSFFFISAYIACDSYILPVKPDYLSSLGLELFAVASAEIDKMHASYPECVGIIYTLIDPRNNLHEPVIEELGKLYGEEGYIFSNRLRYLKAIPEGVNKKRFMLDICDNDIDKEIKLITEEFVKRVGEV